MKIDWNGHKIKAYCKDCEYLYKWIDGGRCFVGCMKIIQPEIYNKYNGRLKANREQLSIIHNDNGDCEYYEEKKKTLFQKLFGKY